MFQGWRVKLREVEESLKVGRLDEALRLLRQDDLLEFLPAKRLAERLALLYAERAKRRAAARDHSGGWRDLDAACSLSELPACDVARRCLIESGLGHAEALLQTGDWNAALARLDHLEQRAPAHPAIGELRQVARHLQSAWNLARHGRFSDAEVHWEAAAGLRPQWEVVGRWHQECRERADRSRPLFDALQQAVGAHGWQSVLKLADELLAMAPEWKVVRSAQQRARNWLRFQVMGRGEFGVGDEGVDTANQGAGERDAAPERQSVNNRLAEGAPQQFTAGRPPADWARRDVRAAASASDSGSHADPSPSGDRPSGRALGAARYLLWVDGVGGYFVCLRDEVVVGQHAPGNSVDIPILGDLSRRHARIRRSGEGYVIEPWQLVRVNGRVVRGASTLIDGDELELGNGVRFRFRQPHALSATARLEPVSRHRTQPYSDGVLLMAESCVLGPKWQNHVVCRDWSGDVVLYRQGGELFCRSIAPVEIDGELCEGRGRLKGNARVVGSDFSLGLEELDRCSSQPLR